MEEKLLKIFKLADLLCDKQDKVYAEIKYSSNNRKELEISIRSKENFEFLENCIFQLTDNLLRWDNIINIFETYVGGAINE